MKDTSRVRYTNVNEPKDKKKKKMKILHYLMLPLCTTSLLQSTLQPTHNDKMANNVSMSFVAAAGGTQ